MKQIIENKDKAQIKFHPWLDFCERTFYSSSQNLVWLRNHLRCLDLGLPHSVFIHSIKIYWEAYAVGSGDTHKISVFTNTYCPGQDNNNKQTITVVPPCKLSSARAVTYSQRIFLEVRPKEEENEHWSASCEVPNHSLVHLTLRQIMSLPFPRGRS